MGFTQNNIRKIFSVWYCWHSLSFCFWIVLYQKRSNIFFCISIGEGLVKKTPKGQTYFCVRRELLWQPEYTVPDGMYTVPVKETCFSSRPWPTAWTASPSLSLSRSGSPWRTSKAAGEMPWSPVRLCVTGVHRDMECVVLCTETSELWQSSAWCKLCPKVQERSPADSERRSFLLVFHRHLETGLFSARMYFLLVFHRHLETGLFSARMYFLLVFRRHLETGLFSAWMYFLHVFRRHLETGLFSAQCCIAALTDIPVPTPTPTPACVWLWVGGWGGSFPFHHLLQYFSILLCLFDDMTGGQDSRPGKLVFIIMYIWVRGWLYLYICVWSLVNREQL